MKRAILIVPLVLFLLVACETTGGFVKNSYRGLGIMSVSYDVAMRSAADLHAKGLISEEGKEEIIGYAESYAIAHNEAVQAFQNYLNTPQGKKENEQAQVVARIAMQSSLVIYGELLSILTKHGIYGEPVEPWF